MKEPLTCIIIGRSGSGKGTQLELLKKHISISDSQRKIQTYICGDAFRAFFKEENELSQLVQTSVNQGNYQPDFLATTLLFRDQVFKTINKEDHIFFDGHPRSKKQLEDIQELLVYTNRTQSIFIDIIVSKEEVTKRMLLRGRADDTELGIEKRQQEYDRAIVPMIDIIKNDPTLVYVAVDGMLAPEIVHQNVLQALSPYIK